MEDRLSIRPEWDAVLTYEILERGGLAAAAAPNDPGPIFVGRRELLDVIVGAIRQPDRRGTFLVSGYRGAGKTTLLIQSIYQAYALLPKDWRLLPLVLNASEVSASLGPAAEGLTLQIGPQQLLNALIRALRNVAESRRGAELVGDLADPIRDTYSKAFAKEYTRAESAQQQQTSSLTREQEIKASADLYKGLTSATGAAAVAVEASAWLSNWLPRWTASLHAGALALLGLSALSWQMSRKVTETAKQETARTVSVKYDNSLQQLEGDLKELLTRLYDRKLRTVVVLEELDKLRDEDGKQLDAVIRYFKNLFTQSPALFFFVTDKAYFDFIAREIRQARRQRTYAIQHTFFTQRLFVGRPTTRDCLDYFKKVLDGPATTAKQLDALYAPDGLRPFSPEIAADPLLRLVRYLVFRASNHLFDLKNELRRFVRVDGDGLLLDVGALTEEESKLGVFQDLVVQKFNSFAIGDGRGYANEVLTDCLYAVFNDLGSESPQEIASFYPHAATGVSPAAPPPEPTPARPPAGASPVVEDQLELSEETRIKKAVDSLVAELQSGNAFDAGKTNVTQGYFAWSPAATQAFRYKRSPENHEKTLLARIDRLRAAMASLGTGGVLANQVGLAGDADALVNRLAARQKEIEESGHPLSADEAERENVDWPNSAAALISTAYGAYCTRVADGYGFRFVPVGRSDDLLLLTTPLGDPRGTASRAGGAVLIAQGEGGRLGDGVREFVRNSPSVQRLAVIHVLLQTPDEAAAAGARIEQWRRDLAEEVTAPRVLAVDIRPLDEGWPSTTIDARWGDKLADRILLRGTWVALAPSSNWPAKAHGGSFTGVANDHLGVESLAAAIRRWLNGQLRVLHIAAHPSETGALMAEIVEVMRGLDLGYAVALPVSGDDPPHFLATQMLQFVGGESDRIERAAIAVAGLISEGAVIPIFADLVGSMVEGGRVPFDSLSPPKPIAQVLGDRGRAIVAAPESWQPVGADGTTLSTLKFTPQTSDSQPS